MYTLRIPFQLQPGRTLGSTGESSATSYRNYTVTLAQTGAGYALSVSGFPSSEAAAAFAPQVWTGLTGFMLEKSSAVSSHVDPEQVTYVDKPKGTLAESFEEVSGRPLQGFADSDKASVFPTDKNIGFMGSGRPTIQITTPAQDALTTIAKGFDLENASELLADDRFRTAVDLYSAAYFEESPSARLLTMVMALEVLSPVSYKHDVALQLIDSWKADMDQILGQHSGDRDAAASLEALRRELLFRKEDSIRGRVRRFVLGSFDGDTATDLSDKAISAYDARSLLLHEGALPRDRLARAVSDAETVLKAIFGKRLGMAAV